MFVALDKSANDLVAIKKVRMMMNDAAIENESRLLKKCVSKYIVRYYDVVVHETELWVGQ